MKNKIWCKDEKNLAIKYWFNQMWFMLGILLLILGVRSIEITGTWEGYLALLMGSCMLIIQQIWLWEIIEYYKCECVIT